MSHRARFISSYQGSATYEIAETYVSGMREVVETRYRGFNDGAYAPGVFEGEIKPKVGTITRYYGAGEWPSETACAAFPQYVPARWNPDTRAIEYRENRQPNVSQDRFGFYASDVIEGVQ